MAVKGPTSARWETVRSGQRPLGGRPPVGDARRGIFPRGAIPIGRRDPGYSESMPYGACEGAGGLQPIDHPRIGLQPLTVPLPDARVVDRLKTARALARAVGHRLGITR